MAGGASRTARLQYLSAPEPGGRQPRNGHDVNDPLLLAPQRGDQQPPLGAGLSDAAAKVSAVGAEKNGTLPTKRQSPRRLGGGAQTPQAKRSRRKDKYNASSGKERKREADARQRAKRETC